MVGNRNGTPLCRSLKGLPAMSGWEGPALTQLALNAFGGEDLANAST